MSDHVGRSLADGPGEHGFDARLELHVRALDARLDPGGGQRHPRAGQLSFQCGLPVAADRLAHLVQGVAGDGFDLGHLTRRVRRTRLHEPAGQLGLDRDHRQAMSEQVVEVAGKALALLGDRHPRQLGPSLLELIVARAQVAHQQHQQPDARGARDSAQRRAAGRSADRRGRSRQHDAEPNRGHHEPVGHDDRRARGAVGEQEGPARLLR